MVVPLRILVLHHPDSAGARALSQGVYRQFMAVGGSPGLRIPVRFGAVRQDRLPPEVALDDAQHTLVVALLDGRMARRAEDSDRLVADAWLSRLAATRAAIGDGGPHALLLAAVDGRAFDLGDQLSSASFIRLDRLGDEPSGGKLEELVFQVGVAALQLLSRGRTAAIAEKAPLQIFVSHAKADLPDDSQLVEGPVKEILAYLSQGPIDGWYDRKKIPPGKRFDEALQDGVQKADAFLCVLTDAWSEREWCRREMLIAKKHGKPIVVVDALETEVPRLFSYIGNSRAMRWKPKDPKALVVAALLEALRHRHTFLVLEQRARPGELVSSSPPEGLTLRDIPGNVSRVLYPDPPLSQEISESLQPVYVVDASGKVRVVELTTPLTELARRHGGIAGRLIGLSLSGATDIDHWGASEEHQATFTDDLATMLLVAGVRLAYGGGVAHSGVRHDSINYTTRLFGLVRNYSPLASQLGTQLSPIVSFVPWPVHLSYGDEELNQYGAEARLERGPRPDLGVDDDALRDEAAARWARARGLLAMRTYMNGQLDARIALGGKLERYSGLMPGILEEVLIARSGERKIPVYLLGGFGGATRMAIDLLLGRSRPEATTGWVKAHVQGYEALVAEYEKREQRPPVPEQYALELTELGKAGPATALGNGLTDEENRELFESTDVHHMVELILHGLGRVLGPAPG